MLVDVSAHGPPIEAGARDLLRVLRAERDDHRQRVDVHLVIDRAADVAHRRDQRLEHALPARLTALGEGVDAADGHDGHRAGAGRMAALDVERLPARPVVHAVERTWKSGWRTARTLASTTGKYSGRQPAITAFAATFSTVTVPWSGSMRPRTSSGAHVAPRSIASTSASVGGTTGRPSVQARASSASLASAKSPAS